MTWKEPEKNKDGKSPRHVEVAHKSSLSNTLRTPITIVPKILDKGYPTNDPTYPESHKKACGREISEFGIDNYLKLEKVVASTPKGELLGTHNKQGNIKISSRVPDRFIPEVVEHEQVEHNLMKLNSWLSKTESEIPLVTSLYNAKKLKMKYKKEWQNEYNEVFEELPANIQEEMSVKILQIPKLIHAKINEYEE